MNELQNPKRISRLVDKFLDYRRNEYADFLKETDQQRAILFMQQLKQEETIQSILTLTSEFYGEFHLYCGSILRHRDSSLAVDWNDGIMFSNSVLYDSDEHDEEERKRFDIYLCPHCHAIAAKRTTIGRLKSIILKFKHSDDCILNNSQNLI
jgi:hypothetical protein